VGQRARERGKSRGEVARGCGMARCDAALPSQLEARSVLCVCVQCAARKELVPGAACHHPITRSPDHPITRLLNTARGTTTLRPRRPPVATLYQTQAPRAAVIARHPPSGIGRCRHHAHAPPLQTEKMCSSPSSRASGPGCFGVSDVSALLHCYHDLSPSCERTFKPLKHRNTETRERERKGKRWVRELARGERAGVRWRAAVAWRGATRRCHRNRRLARCSASACSVPRATSWYLERHPITRSPDHPITRSPDHAIT
jgi:hypothetical protein